MSLGVRPDCVMAFLELERVLDVGFSSYITCSRTGRVCHGAIGCARRVWNNPLELSQAAAIHVCPVMIDSIYACFTRISKDLST